MWNWPDCSGIKNRSEDSSVIVNNVDWHFTRLGRKKEVRNLKDLGFHILNELKQLEFKAKIWRISWITEYGDISRTITNGISWGQW